MTTINPLAPSATAPSTATGPAGAMDQNDFLRLMTTQLTTQDPFNPVDNTQMVAQMAQFSQVAGIAEINQSLKALVSGMTGNRLGDAASWIGKEVLIASPVAAPRADGGYAGEIALPEDADAVSMNLVDGNGEIVHSQDLGARAKGTVAFAWDGKNAAGEAVPGPLKVVVTASKAGTAIEPAVAVWARVNGIQSPASGASAQLLTSLGAISPEDALRLA